MFSFRRDYVICRVCKKPVDAVLLTGTSSKQMVGFACHGEEGGLIVKRKDLDRMEIDRIYVFGVDPEFSLRGRKVELPDSRPALPSRRDPLTIEIDAEKIG